MPDLLVRNVEEHVIEGLKRKAERDGTTLTETARKALSAFARPSKAELLEEMRRIRAMSPYSPIDSTDLIREDRDNDEPYR